MRVLKQSSLASKLSVTHKDIDDPDCGDDPDELRVVPASSDEDDTAGAEQGVEDGDPAQADLRRAEARLHLQGGHTGPHRHFCRDDNSSNKGGDKFISNRPTASYKAFFSRAWLRLRG